MTMRGQRVVLRVPIESDWRAGDQLQVFTDWGDGSIDTSKPLLTRAVRIFPDDPRTTAANPGYGQERYGSTPYGGSAPRSRRKDRGFGHDRYGGHAYGHCTAFLRVPVQITPGYGTWKFAARVADGAGNEQGALQEFSQFVSSENPPPLAAVAFSGYDEGTDKVTLAYTL